jgi:hypothetical protein
MRFLWLRIINDLAAVSTRSFTIAVDCKACVDDATYGNTAEFSFVLIHLFPSSLSKFEKISPAQGGAF